jgi:hypothetical protein
MKLLASVLSILFLVFILAGCSSMQTRDQTQTVTIESAAHPHEECMEMKPGDMLSYSFKTSRPVDFNVHYHEGSDILYPISQKAVSGGEGSYRAEREQIYCLMWTSTRQEPVALTYTFRVNKQSTK